MSQKAVNKYEAVRAVAAVPAGEMRQRRRTQRETLLAVLRIAAAFAEEEEGGSG